MIRPCFEAAVSAAVGAGMPFLKEEEEAEDSADDDDDDDVALARGARRRFCARASTLDSACWSWHSLQARTEPSSPKARPSTT